MIDLHSSWAVCIRAVGLAPVAILIALSGAFTTGVEAQVTASERSTLIQEISGTRIEIDYSRPSVRGRDQLFGELVPWMDVWTPGANDATTFRFSRDVTLNGHEVPAGKYSIWMQPREDEPWMFMLHSDTTLFHVPHRTLEEGFMHFPVETLTTSDHTETLAFQIDSVRADGGLIVFEWATIRVRVELGVDPGFDIAMEPDEARRYAGDWLIDYSYTIPSDSVVDARVETMDEDRVEGYLSWVEQLRERRAKPQPVEIRFVEEGAYLEVLNEAEPLGNGYGQVLIPLAEGIFTVGYLLNGELAFAQAQNESAYWEFNFAADGRATAVTVRDSDDDINGKGERPDG